jgi:hypothetical protein
MHLLYLVLTHWAVASLATTADAEKRQLGVLKTCKLPSLPYCCGAIEDGSSGRTLYSNSCACFQRREAKPKLTSDHRQAEPPGLLGVPECPGNEMPYCCSVSFNGPPAVRMHAAISLRRIPLTVLERLSSPLRFRTSMYIHLVLSVLVSALVSLCC